MFYCNGCATKRNWPTTPFTSHGPCEICGTTSDCNDVPSALLPVPNSDNQQSESTDSEDIYRQYPN